MAKITEADVEYVAGLAHLSVEPDAKARLVKELDDILSYMEKLNELDTADVEPMMHVLEISNVYREDELGHSLSREAALRNAPKSDGEYFVVPRILETE